MAKGPNERMSKTRVVRFGGREVITEGLHLNFWADISHRCMTASWPAFIGGAALVFVAFNAFFALFYWVGDQPISNVPGGDYKTISISASRRSRPRATATCTRRPITAISSQPSNCSRASSRCR
jgi:hypothetical protein